MVMFARPVQGGQVVVDRPRRRRLRRNVRRARKRRAHQCKPAEDVGADHGRPGRNRRAVVVAGQQRNLPVAERVQQSHDVAHQIEQPVGREFGAVVRVPAGRPPVAALVGRDHMVARLRQRRHDAPPAIGQFRKPVQQQGAGPARLLETGFEKMHVEPVAIRRHARTDAGRQKDPTVSGIATFNHGASLRGFPQLGSRSAGVFMQPQSLFYSHDTALFPGQAPRG